jgi:hypothetical protein
MIIKICLTIPAGIISNFGKGIVSNLLMAFDKFTIIADINTEDARSIYLLWATQTGLEKWFLREANFYTISKRLREPYEMIGKEDTYKWFWYGYEEGEKGTILEVNEIDLIKFTFSNKSIVTVNIKTSKGLTLVELTQENIPNEDDLDKNLYVQCQIGWTFYLANLKSIVEGGVDLRNKRTDLKSSFR